MLKTSDREDWPTFLGEQKYSSSECLGASAPGEIEVAERQVLLLADPEISRTKQVQFGRAICDQCWWNYITIWLFNIAMENPL